LRLEQAKRDQYRRRAKEEGYRSRAAYKLKQLNSKYHLIAPGSKIVDMGSAPGGWLQVASEIAGPRGSIVGVDLNPVKQISKQVQILLEDITAQDFADKLVGSLGKVKADCILADLSPKLSGIWDMDHYRQIDLCFKVVDLLPKILQTRGSMIMKAFDGERLPELVRSLKKSFSRVDISKPEASRKESSEVYLVTLDFNGLVSRPQSEVDLSERQYEEHFDSNEYDWQETQRT
jgi:23S rRNA (uridine2552-2'-O)-methyltransferase